jgi:hypothetical protein
LPTETSPKEYPLDAIELMTDAKSRIDLASAQRGIWSAQKLEPHNPAFQIELRSIFAGRTLIFSQIVSGLFRVPTNSLRWKVQVPIDGELPLTGCALDMNKEAVAMTNIFNSVAPAAKTSASKSATTGTGNSSTTGTSGASNSGPSGPSSTTGG